VANGIPVVSVNRVGEEGEMRFWGGSFVANPFGRLLYQAPHGEEVVHVEPIDLAASDSYRVHWPFLRDRRIDSYAPIQKRFIDES
jgi:N-carbamoylputrescine amidase